jgi:dihydroneopterin aldolase
MSEHSIQIEGIECYAYHGCLEEEAKIGGRFSVDVNLHLDLTKAIATDDLSQTADYVVIHNIVREEMDTPSKLIEHVAGRILDKIKSTYQHCSQVIIKVTKFNPPVNGQIERAIVIVTS